MKTRAELLCQEVACTEEAMDVFDQELGEKRPVR